MKKILNWFKKRTASKILIVMFAVCTIGFLIAGMWGSALIEFAFFLSWLALDLKDNKIEVQGKTIEMLSGDLKYEREECMEHCMYQICWMHKYSLVKAKLDFIHGRISASEFGKTYNYYTERIEQDIQNIDDMKKRKEEKDEDGNG